MNQYENSFNEFDSNLKKYASFINNLNNDDSEGDDFCNDGESIIDEILNSYLEDEESQVEGEGDIEDEEGRDEDSKKNEIDGRYEENNSSEKNRDNNKKLKAFNNSKMEICTEYEIIMNCDNSDYFIYEKNK